jgi:hypothetical protein
MINDRFLLQLYKSIHVRINSFYDFRESQNGVIRKNIIKIFNTFSENILN